MRSGKWRWGNNGFLCCAEWPEHRADAARFFGGRSVALTLLTPRAGTAVTNAGGIDHAHAAISFVASFLGIEGKTSRTQDGAIRLRSEVFACDTSHMRDGPHRLLIGKLCLDGTAWFCHRLWACSGREFSGAHRRGMECMAQGEAQVPDPLGENEPELLAPGGVTTPAVQRLFLVFIGEQRLKSATMQVQSHHISRRERTWWQGGVK